MLSGERRPLRVGERENTICASVTAQDGTRACIYCPPHDGKGRRARPAEIIIMLIRPRSLSGMPRVDEGL